MCTYAAMPHILDAFTVSTLMSSHYHRRVYFYLLFVCGSYKGEDDASNMAVFEVKMVSGWLPEKQSLKRVSRVSTLTLVQKPRLVLKQTDLCPSNIWYKP